MSGPITRIHERRSLTRVGCILAKQAPSRKGLELVKSLCNDDARAQTQLVEEGGIPALVKALASEWTLSLDILVMVCTDSEVALDQIIEAGVSETLLQPSPRDPKNLLLHLILERLLFRLQESSES